MTTQVQEKSGDTRFPTNSAVADLGKQAVAKWASRDKNGAQGDALGFIAIVQAYETMSFSAIWTEKEDGKPRSHRLDFDLKDYMTKQITNANGTRNNKATQARTEAIMFKVFGVEKPTAAQLQSLRRVVNMAKDFIGKGYSSKDCKLTSRGYLEIPYVLMHDEPKADASERDHKTWAKNKDDTEVLDNTNGMSVSKFAQRIAPKRAPNTSGTGNQASTAETLSTSVKFVTAIIDKFNDPNGESDVAPNAEMRQALFELQTKLGVYFKADPIEKPARQRRAA